MIQCQKALRRCLSEMNHTTPYKVPGDFPFLYETHMHTSEVSACAVSTAAQQVRYYKENGYAGIIVTNHFINGYNTIPPELSWEKKMRFFARGYDAAKIAGADYDLDVFFGWEFTIEGLDFLTYALDLDFLISNPNLNMLDIEDYSLLVRENGGFLAQAHPFRSAWYMSRSGPVAPHLIDAVEVYNSMDPAKSNAAALSFAKKHNLPIQAGSDSHSAPTRELSGIKLRNRASSINDIIDAIIAFDVALI